MKRHGVRQKIHSMAYTATHCPSVIRSAGAPGGIDRRAVPGTGGWSAEPAEQSVRIAAMSKVPRGTHELGSPWIPAGRLAFFALFAVAVLAAAVCVLLTRGTCCGFRSRC